MNIFQIKDNPCNDNPCVNGATCMTSKSDSIYLRYCVCPSGYTGTTCSICKCF